MKHLMTVSVPRRAQAWDQDLNPCVCVPDQKSVLDLLEPLILAPLLATLGKDEEDICP